MNHLYEKIISQLGITVYRLEMAAIGKGAYKQSVNSGSFPTAKALVKVKKAFPEVSALIDEEQRAWEAQQLAEIQESPAGGLSESNIEYTSPSKGERLSIARAALGNTAGKSYNPKSVEGALKLLEPTEPLPESIPITEDVFAAGDGGFDDLYPQIVGYMQASQLKDCTRAVYAKGDSMEPVFSSGDMLGIEDLPPTATIMPGYIYAISYERYSVVKRLRKSEKGDAYILLCSDNANYGEVEIKRKEIVRIAIVRTVLPFSKIITLY